LKKKKFRRYDHTDGLARRPKGPVGQFLEIWLENIWSLIPINVLYSFLRMLLIPSGLAQVGMTCVTSDLVRQRHSFGAADFMETMKKCWRKALPAGLILLLVWVFLLLIGWFYFTSAGILAAMGLGCCMMAMAFCFVAEQYIWLQIMIFKLPIKKIFKNAALFVFVNWKKNLFLFGIRLVFAIIAAVIFLLAPYLLPVYAFFVPGFENMLIQSCVFPSIKEHLIDPYYAEHPQEDMEQRKKLGLL
jgi:uncharacterized membrane protein YesL